MKKFILVCILFLSIKGFSQKANLEVYFECFKNGDTLSMESVDKVKDIILTKDGLTTTDLWFKSWEMVVFTGTKPTTYPCFSGSAKVLDNMKTALKAENVAFKKFVLQKLIIYDKSGNGMVEKRLDPCTFYIGKVANKICGATLADTKRNELANPIVVKTPAKAPLIVNYSGKILMGKEKNKPFMNQKIVLEDQITKELKSTMTNNYGDFTFNGINANDSIRMKFDGNAKEILDGELFIAKPDGTIVRGFNKANNVFYYDFIPPELVTLTQVKEEDTELKLKNFNSSNLSEITVVEDIHYAPNSFEIDPDATKKLDGLANAMTQNKSLKLTITSHTDSKGDDAYNLTLSQKRAQKVLEYFVTKGIDKSRLVAKGLGETMILNRCKNGVDCSETEHQVNRRTEFKFTK